MASPVCKILHCRKSLPRSNQRRVLGSISLSSVNAPEFLTFVDASNSVYIERSSFVCRQRQPLVYKERMFKSGRAQGSQNGMHNALLAQSREQRNMSARETTIGILTGCARATIAAACYCKAATPTACAVQTKRQVHSFQGLKKVMRETTKSPCSAHSVLPCKASLSLDESFKPSGVTKVSVPCSSCVWCRDNTHANVRVCIIHGLVGSAPAGLRSLM